LPTDYGGGKKRAEFVPCQGLENASVNTYVSTQTEARRRHWVASADAARSTLVFRGREHIIGRENASLSRPLPTTPSPRPRGFGHCESKRPPLSGSRMRPPRARSSSVSAIERPAIRPAGDSSKWSPASPGDRDQVLLGVTGSGRTLPWITQPEINAGAGIAPKQDPGGAVYGEMKGGRISREAVEMSFVQGHPTRPKAYVRASTT